MIMLLRLLAHIIPKVFLRWLIYHNIDAWTVRSFKTPYYPLPGYMNRWWLFKYKWFFGQRWSCRVHETLRSDMDRFLHDHPYDNVSIVLRGMYIEIMPTELSLKHSLPGYDLLHRAQVRTVGDIIVRKAEDPHKLMLVDQEPVWSLFFVRTDRKRSWGFWTDKGWVHWKKYVDPNTLSPEELEELNAPDKTSGEKHGIAYGKRHGYESLPTTVGAALSRSAFREEAYEKARREESASKRGTSGEER